MKDKVVVILEIILLFIMAVVVFFKDALPNYRKTHGSSDHILNTRKYNNMIEWNIDNNINFSIILDEDGNVYHMLFFSKEARCLYNQNIEKKSLEEATHSIIRLLIENNYLKDNSNIEIIRYNSNFYEEFHNYLVNNLNTYNSNYNLEEKEVTLQEKALELQMENVSNKTEYDILWELEDYSRNYLRTSASTKQKETTETDNLTEESFKTYADNIYKKINNYKEDNQIKELEKDNTALIIQVIPADADGKYYPSPNSWYYIQDGKIYAYIEFIEENKIYGYCYQKTIESRNKGVCK